MKDYYKILGVKEDAAESDIKKAYRELALVNHPDRNKDDKVAENKMKEINEAYQTLGDPEKRRVYDVGSNNPNIDPREQINDILRGMGFNINIDFTQSNPLRQQKMQFKHQISINLHDAIFGCEVDVDIPSYMNCDACGGNGGQKITCKSCSGAGQTFTFLGTLQYPVSCVACGAKGFTLASTCQKCNQEGYKRGTKHVKIKVPAGVKNHSIMRLKSDPNDRCEVLIVVNVLRHDTITRQNNDVLSSIEKISCFDAILGCVKTIELIDGKYELTIPQGVQYGQQISIQDRGALLNNKRVEHVVVIEISTPRELDNKDMEKIKHMRDKLNKRGK